MQTGQELNDQYILLFIALFLMMSRIDMNHFLDLIRTEFEFST